MPAVIDTSRILALAAAIGPTLALYNALGVAPLFVVTALAATVAAARTKPWLAVSRAAALGLAALVAWTGLSMAWTIEPGMGTYTAIRMLGFAVGARPGRGGGGDDDAVLRLHRRQRQLLRQIRLAFRLRRPAHDRPGAAPQHQNARHHR